MKELDKLASQLVGDGRNPNIYFVSDKGKVQTITTNKDIAILNWKRLAARRPYTESEMEDRHVGVIAQVFYSDDDKRWITVED